MTGNPAIEQRAMDMDEYVHQQQLGWEMAGQRRPDLAGSIGQIVAANDYASMIRTQARVMAGGVTGVESLVQVGSFARMDHVLALINAGPTLGWPDEWIAQDIYPQICEIWRGADPDDTNPKFQMLFEYAKKYQGGDNPPALHDGKPLASTTLGDTVRTAVYRGEGRILRPGSLRSEHAGGLSWTTDIKVAKRFGMGADRRQPIPNGTVLLGTVAISDVLAYITGRGESELIIPPNKVLVSAMASVSSAYPNQAPSWKKFGPIYLTPLSERTHP